MKFQYLIIVFLFVSVYSVAVKSYQSEKAPKTTNTFADLSGIKAECPNKGAMKNFKVVDDGSNVYYDMVCYSSDVEGTEYDNSVLKTGFGTYSMAISGTTKKDLTILANFKVLCPVDYAVNSFWITYTDKITLTYTCINTKPITETNGLTLTTNTASVTSVGTLEGLTKLTAGYQLAETDEIKGVALRGFQLVVSGNTVSYKYGTLTLKNVESLKAKYLASSAAYRSNNNQKY